jgi:hypothetical protein
MRNLDRGSTADILSGLSLNMRIDTLDEPTMNQVVVANQHVLRILIVRADRSGE